MQMGKMTFNARLDVHFDGEGNRGIVQDAAYVIDPPVRGGDGDVCCGEDRLSLNYFEIVFK